MMGGVYILNQIIDRESDKENRKLFLISDGYIPLKYAYMEMISLWILSFLMIIPFSSLYKVLFIVSFVFGILYSLPPFHFKARPFLDLFSNAFGYGILNFAIGWLTAGKYSNAMWLHGIPYFLAVGGVFINTTIPDIPGDKSAGEITTGVFLGEKLSLYIAFIFIIGSAVFSFLLKDWFCFSVSIISLPFFLVAAIKSSLKYVLYSIRIPAPLLILIISIVYPYFFLLLVVMFFFLKIYYKKRFNFNYPGVLSGYSD